MEGNKNKTAYIWLLVIIILAFFAYAMWRPTSSNQKATSESMETTNQQTTPDQNDLNASDNTAPVESTAPANTDNSTAPSNNAMGNTKEITITASNYKFDTTEIRVNKGDTVKLTLKNNEGFHDWRIDEFNAATQRLTAGQSETITFVADKTGTFEYYCSVGNHRAMGMKGNLIVQ